MMFNSQTDQGQDPLISVICINKNHGDYIEDTIQSVLMQKFDRYELIVADGGSTDDSVELIKKYKSVRLLEGNDTSRADGLIKALAFARGKYVMVTTSTDGYLSRNWFAQAARVLDEDIKTSLVFGASASMAEDGTLGNVTWPAIYPFHSVPPKEDWPGIWLTSGLDRSYLPELNYCVRTSVFRACFGFSDDFSEINEIADPILRFHFEFNRCGYLPHYLPIQANFGRVHPNQEQLTARNNKNIELYEAARLKYVSEVLAKKRRHLLRDGGGNSFAEIEMQVG